MRLQQTDTDARSALDSGEHFIVLGMPSGFYPGYDREIHELFVYSIEPR